MTFIRKRAKAGHSSVPVRVRMDVANQPIAEDGAHRRCGFALQQVEQCRHGIAHCFPAWRHMLRALQIDRAVAVTGERRRGLTPAATKGWNSSRYHSR